MIQGTIHKLSEAELELLNLIVTRWGASELKHMKKSIHTSDPKWEVALKLVLKGLVEGPFKNRNNSTGLRTFAATQLGLDHLRAIMALRDEQNQRKLPEPTDASPGSQGKVEVLRQRASRNENLFSPNDGPDGFLD